MLFRSPLGIVVAAVVGTFVAVLVPPPAAIAFPGPDAQCPYGWDTSTNTCLPNPGAGNGGGSNDAACQATARFDYCQRSVFIGCRTSGIEFACRLLALSKSDPITFHGHPHLYVRGCTPATQAAGKFPGQR